jgi:iron complex outermembrane receptor protein
MRPVTTLRGRRGVLATLGAAAAALVLGSPLLAPAQDQQQQTPADVPAPTARGGRSSVEAITVTARKVEESLQEAAVSVTVLDSLALEGGTVTNLTEFENFTPNLRIEKVNGSANNSNLAIRGLAANDPIITTDPSVGMYIDEVYIARGTGVVSNIFDVQRVEVLKGPQGTLYGKNTTGGAVKVITRFPDGTLGGWGKVRAGSYDLKMFEGAVQFPIVSEVLAGRIAFQAEQRDGYFRNNINPSVPQTPLPFPFGSGLKYGGRRTSEDKEGDIKSLYGRANFAFTPTEEFDVKVTLWRRKERGQNQQPDFNFQRCTLANCALFGPATGTPVPDINGNGSREDELSNLDNDNVRDGMIDYASRTEVDDAGTGMVMEYDLTENMTLRSITGYHWMKSFRRNDLDGTPWEIFHNDTLVESQTVNQEFNLLGSTANERLDWILGGLWFTERGKEGANSWTFPLGANPTGTNRRTTYDRKRSWSVFGNGTYHLTDRLSFSAGLRTDYEWRYADRAEAYQMRNLSLAQGNIFNDPRGRCRFLPHDTAPLDLGNCSVQRDNRWSFVSWSTGTEFQATDDLMLYGKAAKAFKSGGLQGRPDTVGAARRVFDQEEVTTYELGAKSGWFDNRLIVNLAAFYSSFVDAQVPVFNAAGDGIVTITQNVGRQYITGGELEMTARPFEGLLLRGGLGLMYRQIKHFSENQFCSSAATIATCGQVGTVWRLDRSGEKQSLPPMQLSLTAQYTVPIQDWAEMVFQGDFYYLGQQNQGGVVRYTDPTKVSASRPFGENCAINPGVQPAADCQLSNPFFYQGSYGIFNGRVAFRHINQGWELAFWAKNIADREAHYGGIDLLGSFGISNLEYIPPREVGVEFTYRFGSDKT